MAEELKQETKEFLDEIPTEGSKESENTNGELKIARAKIPRGEEVIGVIEERLGGNKMKVNCLDGKIRNSRVPGRLKRKLWLRPGDIVLIEPWELDKTKGDVIFKYPSNQIEWLKRNGYLKNQEKEF